MCQNIYYSVIYESKKLENVNIQIKIKCYIHLTDWQTGIKLDDCENTKENRKYLK